MANFTYFIRDRVNLEGIERGTIVEKTIPGIKPDKSGVMFKVSVHNEEGMKEFVAGKNPVAKAIYEECVASVHLYELSKVNV